MLASFAIALAACDAAPSDDDASTSDPTVAPRFEPMPDPVDFGAVPWPDDLYLDRNGRIAVGSLPGEGTADAAFVDALRETLGELDGFSSVAPIFFFFPPGSIDPASLPGSAAASAREDSPIFIVDVDPASPRALRRIPAIVHWNAELGQLAIRPSDGHPLVPGRRYAAVVTDAVRDDRGAPIGPSAAFRAVRDAAARPSDALNAEIYERYAPVLSTLVANGVPRSRVAGLAVFTVQSVLPDLRDARAIVRAGDSPIAQIDRVFGRAELDRVLGVPDVAGPGLDDPGGVEHSHLAALVHGRFAAPTFVVGATGRGSIVRDDAGALVVRGTESVPFTLTLPLGDLARVPLIVFQHALGAERSEMLVIADVLAAAGYACIAIDAPFHGQRVRGAVDLDHAYGPSVGPDGFGDRRGDDVLLSFLGILDAQGDRPPHHPVIARDALRQLAIDLSGLARLVREGDWSALATRPEIGAFGFADGSIGLIALSLGADAAALAIAVEPAFDAVVLAGAGGDLLRAFEASATWEGTILRPLLARLGVDVARYDPQRYPASFHPEIALAQTLLDRGDAIAVAPTIAGQASDLLLQTAQHDEFVPNRSTEALARATGAEIVGVDPVHTDLLRTDAPLSANLEVDEVRATRGLYRFAPATHRFLTQRVDLQRHDHPPTPPFTPIAPIAIANPIDAAVEQVVFFFESRRSGSPAQIRAPE